MKVTQTEDIETGKFIFVLEILPEDLVHAKPSRFATEAKRVYHATGKISDLLFYLSEEAEAIEDGKEENLK